MKEKLSIYELSLMLKSGLDRSTALVDVRSPQEFAKLHIQGAINIPYQLLQFRYDELETFDTLILYCSAGVRSEIACEEIEPWGLKKIFYVSGPKGSWETAHIPLESWS